MASDADDAAQCGTVGQVATCTGSHTVKLSTYPMGRIEVYNPWKGDYGTVCGHWLWDNDNYGNMVCQELGYAGGILYTYGSSLACPRLGWCSLPSSCSNSNALTPPGFVRQVATAGRSMPMQAPHP